MSTKRVFAVIPAAGLGQRCDEYEPKQLIKVCDEPLIHHTIEAFLRIKMISKIIVVSSQTHRNQLNEIISKCNHEGRVDCVDGGPTRHRSIHAAIQYISENQVEPDIVVIQDGARPLLDDALLYKIIDAANSYGASGVFCKLTSTVLSITEDHFLDHALNRQQYYASEMPQAFRFQVIKQAYDQCLEYDFNFNTECLDLAQRYASSKVKLIEGSGSDLWKVTYKKDIYAADATLRDQQNVLFSYFPSSELPLINEFADEMEKILNNSFAEVQKISNYDEMIINDYHRKYQISIIINFCDSWKQIFSLNNKIKYKTFVIILITREELDSIFYQHFIKWSKQTRHSSKRRFIIHCNFKELEDNKEQIKKSTIYLAKQSPEQINGQIIFI